MTRRRAGLVAGRGRTTRGERGRDLVDERRRNPPDRWQEVGDRATVIDDASNVPFRCGEPDGRLERSLRRPPGCRLRPRSRPR